MGLSKAPRLSIVVLPFENLSGDPKEDYLAEGITEDVTTDLSRVPGMFVIARESAYTYQGKAVDVRKIGEELGVRYVLEGSVRKLGDTLRVNAQLIATETARIFGRTASISSWTISAPARRRLSGESVGP